MFILLLVSRLLSSKNQTKKIQAAASEVNFRRAVFSLLTMIAGGSTLALDYCFVKKWENRKFVMMIRNKTGSAHHKNP